MNKEKHLAKVQRKAIGKQKEKIVCQMQFEKVITNLHLKIFINVLFIVLLIQVLKH